MSSLSVDSCRVIGADPTPQQLTQIEQYLDLLERWNRAYNLTAIRQRDRMATHHIYDSLAIGRYLSGSRLLDVGTGAGLPGIPLAITHPEKQFLLLDSNGKKTRFLEQVVAQLRLPNVRVIQIRAEQLVDHCGFDMVLSRAFARIAVMLRSTDHLVASNGQWLAMKGIYPADELNELPAGVELEASHRLIIPGVEAERHLVVLRRTIDKH